MSNDQANHIFEVQVYLNEIDAEEVRVQLCAEGGSAGRSSCVEMERVRPLVGASNGFVYHAATPSSRPASDYTARVIPYLEGTAVPLEFNRVLWQR